MTDAPAAGPATSATEMRWSARAVSLKGHAHQRNGLPCQDASAAYSTDDEILAAVAVADGHGSERCFRSERGAHFAVEALSSAFSSAIHQSRKEGAHRETLWDDWVARHLVAQWREMVVRDLLSDPPLPDRDEALLDRYLQHVVDRRGWKAVVDLCGELDGFASVVDELAAAHRDDIHGAMTDPLWTGDWQLSAYGSTALGVLVGPEALHWVRIGDGALVKVVGGGGQHLVPPPDEAIANQTPSLSQRDAVTYVDVGTERFGVGTVPSAVLVVTDGVTNAFVDEGGFLEFCVGVAEQASSSEIEDDLRRWLPQLSDKTGDDVSLALAWATEGATIAVPEHQAATEVERQRVDVPALEPPVAAGQPEDDGAGPIRAGGERFEPGEPPAEIDDADHDEVHRDGAAAPDEGKSRRRGLFNWGER